jgi:hypothetical protein
MHAHDAFFRAFALAEAFCAGEFGFCAGSVLCMPRQARLPQRLLDM